ncbi:hypothetical protein Tco_0652769 [Tanacetum coccineum]|uniref:Uncharacterized protein n=1 Tax=Tanacetum coccineum TaxID=301880 RepID=A0ABQ4WZA5_9ASTR
MAEIGFFIDILLGFPGPSDGLRLHSIVFFSSGSGLTADSSVLTLTLTFLDFGLDFAQSFPFHAQLCHFGLHEVARTPLSAVVAYNPETAERNYLDAVRALEEADFPLVHLLKSKKDSGMDEVLDCFLFDGPLADLPKAAHLQPCLEQLFVPNYHADVNVVVRETSLSFALLNVHTRGEGAKRHASALRQLMVDIVSHPCPLRTS